MIILSDDLQETIARIFLYTKNYQIAIIFQTREKQEVFRQGLIEKLNSLPDWSFFKLKTNNKSHIAAFNDVHLFLGISENSLQGLSIDLCYIDGAHKNFKGVREAALPSLKNRLGVFYFY